MKQRKIRVSLVFTLLFLACLVIMDYPFLARLVNERKQGEVVVDYEHALKEVEDEEIVQMREAAHRYNKNLASGVGPGMLELFEEEAAGAPFHKEYRHLLDNGQDGVMGTVEIPKIHVNLMIYHGTSDEVLQKGAGHLEGSSLPVGGEGTHACISAHRGLVSKKMFTDLDELEEGDIFLLHILNETLCYRVGSIRTVLPDEIESLAIRRGEDLVTLITCTPYGINTHRLYIEGSRIPYTEETVEQVREESPGFRWQEWWWAALTVLLIIAMCIMLYRYNRKTI